MSKKISTLSRLNARTAIITAAGAKFAANIQEHILNIATYIHGEGDRNFEPATVLYNAMPNGSNREYVKAWFADYCGGRWAKADDKSATDRFVASGDLKKGTFTYDAEEAAKHNWFDKKVTESTSDGLFDLNASMKSFLKRAQKAITEGKTKGDLPETVINSLQTIADFLGETDKEFKVSLAQPKAAEVVELPAAEKVKRPRKGVSVVGEGIAA